MPTFFFFLRFKYAWQNTGVLINLCSISLLQLNASAGQSCKMFYFCFNINVILRIPCFTFSKIDNLQHPPLSLRWLSMALCSLPKPSIQYILLQPQTLYFNRLERMPVTSPPPNHSFSPQYELTKCMLFNVSLNSTRRPLIRLNKLY